MVSSRVDAGGVQRLERAQQDRQALALLGAADEEQVELAGSCAAPLAPATPRARSTPFGITR